MIDPCSPDPVCVVGVGASAGGVAALSAFFRSMPFCGCGFVVVLHGASGELVSVLRGVTDLCVMPAIDGARLQRNVVFVASGVDAGIESTSLRPPTKGATGRSNASL